MKIKPAPLQPDSIPFKLSGVMVRDTPFGWVVQKLPDKDNARFSPLVKQYRTRFGFAGRMASNPNPLDMQTAHYFAKGTQQVPRDVLTAAALGRYFILVNPDGTEWTHVEGPIFSEDKPVFPTPPVEGYDFWLDAAQLVTTEGQAITAWPDLTGTYPDLISMTPDHPTGRLSWSPTGLPAVEFTGAEWMRRLDSKVAQPLTRFFMLTNTRTNGGTITAGGNSDPYCRIGSNVVGSAWCQIRSPDAGFALGAFPWPLTARAVQLNGALSYRWNNFGRGGPTYYGINGRWGLSLAALNGGDNRMYGHICEIIDYPFVLDATQVADTMEYLNVKWGQTV